MTIVAYAEPEQGCVGEPTEPRSVPRGSGAGSRGPTPAVLLSGCPVRTGTFAVSEDGLFDGFRIDRDGNVWTSRGRGIDVYAPDGTLIGRIPVPELVSNLTFGGRRRNRLFITAQTSLYALYVNQHPPGW